MAEIEAKFLIRHSERLADLLAFLDTRGYAVEARGAATHLDTYFDTADWALFREGWTYRCRQRGNASTLTLKSLGKPDGSVFIRDEIVQPLPTPPASLPDGSAPGPVDAILGPLTGTAAKRKLFSVRTRRTAYCLRPPANGKTSIELAVDETRIRAQQAREDATGRLDFTEIELELEAGEPQSLADLARLLRDREGLLPAHLSKFERGLHTAGLRPSIGADDAISATGNEPVLPVLFRFLSGQHRRMLDYQPVAWEGLDPEGVHKMRVASRRVRALLRAFREILAAELESGIEAELRWLAGQLGSARDADICLRDMARYDKLLSADAATATDAYLCHLEQNRADAYDRLAETFASERYAALMTRFESFVGSGAGEKTREKWSRLSVEDCAARLIGETARKVCARGDKIHEGSAARKLHRLRIAAKRLRYLLEFFSLAQPGRWAGPIAALQKLHDLLGDHQDAVTSRALLTAYADSIPSGAAPRDLLIATGRMLQIEDQRIADARARFPAVWKRFRRSMAEPAPGSVE